MNKPQTVIEITKRAIEESGKPFDKIPMDAILKFLADNGVRDANNRKIIYKTLTEHYSFLNEFDNVKEARKATEEVRPGKEPRKSVFGEIKRIA